MSKNRYKMSKTYKNKSSINWTTIIASGIGLLGVIITAYFSFEATTNQVEKPIQATQTAEARQSIIALSATPVNLPTYPAVGANTPRHEFIGYDFENDTQGWQTSEHKYKPDPMNTSTLVAYHGEQSLVLDTELYGNGSAEFVNHNSEDAYRHTEAMVFFDEIPSGIDIGGPYDLTGKRLSCFVYLPNGLVAPNAGPPAYVRLVVKDKEFDSLFSEPINITRETAEKWLELVIVVKEDISNNFDSTRVFGMGVRLDSLDNSPVSYKGPIFIDYCTIGF